MRIFRALLCIVLGSLLGLCAGLMLDMKVLTEVAKWSVGIFAFLWTVLLGFITKVADVTDVPGIDYEEHRKLDAIVKSKIKRLWALARWNILAAILCLPLTLQLGSTDFSSPLWAALIGGLIGSALFCVLLYEDWLEELREFRSNLKEKERINKAREALMSQIGKDPSLDALPVDENLDSYSRCIH